MFKIMTKAEWGQMSKIGLKNQYFIHFDIKKSC